MKKKVILYSIFLFLIDQITKFIFDRFFELDVPKRIFDMFFYITKTYNTGISFSLLSGSRILIILISLVILVFLYYYMKHFKENKRNLIAFSFIFGGLLGNLADRIIHGYVIDFLDFYIFGYNFPVFNIADMGICIGVALLLYSIYRGEDNENISRNRKQSKTR